MSMDVIVLKFELKASPKVSLLFETDPFMYFAILLTLSALDCGDVISVSNGSSSGEWVRFVAFVILVPKRAKILVFFSTEPS